MSIAKSNSKEAIKQKMKGCLAENIAMVHFQKEGKYVFNAAQTKGPIDLIVVDPHTFQIDLYDIKSMNYRKNKTKIYRPAREKNKNIKIAYVENGEFMIPGRKS